MNKCELADSPALSLILMFKTYVANKPSVDYTTKTNVNEADWPFETEHSSVNDNVTRRRLSEVGGEVEK